METSTSTLQADVLPERATLTFEGVRIVMRHRLQDVTELDRSAADMIVVGHSHKPLVGAVGGVLEVIPAALARDVFRYRSRWH